MSSVLKLKQLQEITGKNDKIAFIASNKDDKDFLELLKVLLDGFEVLGIKSLDKERYSEATGFLSKDILNFRTLVKFLKSTTRSNKTLEEVYSFLSKCNVQEVDLYAGIITKKLKLGVTSKSVNKALGYSYISNFTLMKAEPFKESLLDWSDGYLYGEEKYDGVRAVIIIENNECKAFTYNGKPLNLPTIFKAILKLHKNFELEDFVFDIELLHKESRTKTSGCVNRILKNDFDKANDSELYAEIFHYMTLEEFKLREPKQTQKQVAETLSTMNATFTHSKIKFSESWVIRNLAEAQALFIRVRDEDGEGIMLKKPSAKYEWKRSKHWIKLKSIYSTTLKVTGEYLAGAETKYKGLLGGLICETSDGVSFRVGGGFSDDQRVEFMEGSMRGKLVEIIFTDVNYDKNDSIFLDFPRFKEERFDKVEADDINAMLGEVPKFQKRIKEEVKDEN